MKVLKKGSNQAGWTMGATCTGAGNLGRGAKSCGSKLLLSEADLFTIQSSHYDGSTEFYTTFQCEVCGVLTDLPETGHLPRGLPSQATWKKNRPKPDEVVLDVGEGKTVKVLRSALPALLQQIQASLKGKNTDDSSGIYAPGTK